MACPRCHPAGRQRTGRTEAQERSLRKELRQGRRPDDQFFYEIVVVVPSFDDAVIATRLNFALQACVVRRRFGDRPAYDTSSLAHFVGDPGLSCRRKIVREQRDREHDGWDLGNWLIYVS